MAERRKNKKKKELNAKDRNAKPTKEEYAVAKYLKTKLPEKKTTLMGHKVEYLIASKAVDCLLESPWASPNKSEINFNNRDSAVEFMERLLFYKFFHRAKKIIVQKDPKKKKKEEEAGRESAKEKDSKDTKGKREKEGRSKKSKKETEVVEKKKEKKKIKFDMHMEQIFIDSNEPYVWIYDPIPVKTWIIGSLMVVGAVLVCLFPLWPQTIRHYIYYLSVAVAFFLAFIIGLAVLRFVVFVLIWIVTFGKHHLWLLPNLTEEVGFFESFWPLYQYEYRGSKDPEKEKESPKEAKHKSEDEKMEEEEKTKEDEEKTKEEEEEEEDKSDSSSDQEPKTGEQAHTASESEEEKASVDNGFELVEAEEVDEDEEDRKTK